MAKCPLCSRRPAKRHCPAKAVRICSVCCGTKREIEIDCPADCVHLQTGREYESARGLPADALSDMRRFNVQFLERHGALISTMVQLVVDEAAASPEMVDREVRDAFDALRSTLKTLSAGIYYETLPSSGPRALSLYRRIKLQVDQWTSAPAVAAGGFPAPRVSDVLDALDFMIATAGLQSGDRPRSRRYLGWLSAMQSDSAPPAKRQASRLILP